MPRSHRIVPRSLSGAWSWQIQRRSALRYQALLLGVLLGGGAAVPVSAQTLEAAGLTGKPKMSRAAIASQGSGGIPPRFLALRSQDSQSALAQSGIAQSEIRAVLLNPRPHPKSLSLGRGTLNPAPLLPREKKLGDEGGILMPPSSLKPETAKPETVKPDSAQPHIAKPDVAKPEAVKPESAKPESAKPESAKPESAKPESAKPETVKPDHAKPETVKPDSAKPDNAKPDVAKPETLKPDVAKPETLKPDSAKPETLKPDSAKPDVAKPETLKPDSAKPDSAKPDSAKPEAAKPDGNPDLQPIVQPNTPATGEAPPEAPPIPTLAERCAAQPTNAEATAGSPTPNDSAATPQSTPALPPSGAGPASNPGVIPASNPGVGPESNPGPNPGPSPVATQPSETQPSETQPAKPEDEVSLKQAEEAAKKAAAEAKELQLVCQLYEADQLYQAGKLDEARDRYRQLKPDFKTTRSAAPAPPAAIANPEDLPPAGRVYWREYEAGKATNLQTRMQVPLDLLVRTYPQFIPGHIQLAQVLDAAGQPDQALKLLEEASRTYPQDLSLANARIAQAERMQRWMDAAMVARQFAQLYPASPEAERFNALAETNIKRYQGALRDRLTANTIANLITGALSYAATGSIWNSLSSLQTTYVMLRGESGVGESIGNQVERQLPLVEDPEVIRYVEEMGQKLAKLAGRSEFDYRFRVLLDPSLNAFALPGGKIFVNAGAIAATKSEAELAGLLAHEISHAVLSHGFQLVSEGNLLADVTRFIPFGGFATNLIVLNYSRDMERQADDLGTRILANAGYAADGLHNLMIKLGEEDKKRPIFAWLSTHPETEERIGNIERLIEVQGLDRFKFEGVERHARMRLRVKQLLEEAEKKAKEKEERRRNRLPW